ncbi:MAG TPA: DUF2007 domain-containing protein [Ohtaekwangia sp.]
MEESDEIILFQQFSNPIDANIIKTKLDAHDIPCFLTQENLANLYPGNHLLAFQVRLHLFAKDSERARQVIKEQYLSVDDDSILSCPTCRSTAIERDFPKGLTENLLTGLGVLFFGLFIPQKKVYHCRDCNREFN